MTRPISDYRRRIDAVLAQRVPRGKIDGKGVPWTFIEARTTDHTYDFAYRVPIGYSAEDVRKQADAFYASCGAVVDIVDRAGAVVISVYPNEMPRLIPFDPAMLSATEGRTLLLGYDRQMRPVTHDFRVPHGLFAGTSGYGKTELIKFLLLQLISRFTPEEIDIQIIDMKQTSYKEFRGIPHITRIARDLPTAVDVLSKSHRTMIERGSEIWESDEEINYKLILIVIDEGGQIAPSEQSTKDAKKIANIAWSAAGSLACVGRELGLGIWFCTQRPDANHINPQVKANVDMAVCFHTKTRSNSEIVLDRPGAEKLPQDTPGRAIYSTTSDAIFQAPFIPKHDWPRILEPYRRTVIAGDIDGGAQPDEREDSCDTFAVFDAPDCGDQPSGTALLSWRGFPEEASVRSPQRLRASQDHRRETSGG